MVECAAQPHGVVEAFGGLLMHDLVEEHHLIAAPFFGPVQGGIGVPQQGLGVGCLGGQRDADAGRDVTWRSSNENGSRSAW